MLVYALQAAHLLAKIMLASTMEDPQDANHQAQYGMESRLIAAIMAKKFFFSFIITNKNFS